jgi:hypothetical protein
LLNEELHNFYSSPLCSRNERNGLAWLKAGVWKLRGIRRGWEKGICPLCRDNEEAKHILLRCPETKQEVLERTNLPTFLTLFKNVICIKTSVCPNITLVGIPY